MEYDCVEEFQLLRGPRGHTTCREQEAGETGLDIVLTVLGNDRRNLQILRIYMTPSEELQSTFAAAFSYLVLPEQVILPAFCSKLK